MGLGYGADRARSVATGQTGRHWVKTAITRAEWENAAGEARSPLGALKSRTLKSATFARTLPGAPAGEYVVIQFETAFEHKASATETITPMLEKDGSWKVAGYYIK